MSSTSGCCKCACCRFCWRRSRSRFAPHSRSGTAGKVVGQLVIWLLVTVAIVGVITVLVSTTIFNLMPLDQSTSNRIGALFGAAANRVDIEFALSPDLAIGAGTTHELRPADRRAE